MTPRLRDKLIEQHKTVVNGPLGQVETWVDTRTFWAYVKDVSNNVNSGWMSQRGQEGTQTLYEILARDLNRKDWTFKNTRFVWLTPDLFSTPRILKPMQGVRLPNRKTPSKWALIQVQDITDFVTQC
jgi:hypothetical protein